MTGRSWRQISVWHDLGCGLVTGMHLGDKSVIGASFGERLIGGE